MRIAPAIVILAVILVFVFQNSRHVTVSLFTASGSLPLSLALLGAAALGALFVLALGSVRILQMRRWYRRGGPRGDDHSV
ncbi:MAG TPA: lipopolysaccharide assembly protein LapA domain-containing protein [Acidimicrobiales bacterium]|nr:lipopolysaccharide assembly protein LapA domain-containing protein [Acidimicrobiales bacterium]